MPSGSMRSGAGLGRSCRAEATCGREPLQQSGDEQADVGADRQRRSRRIRYARNIGINIDVDEALRRNHRRIPKRRWLAQTGS